MINNIIDRIVYTLRYSKATKVMLLAANLQRKWVLKLFVFYIVTIFFLSISSCKKFIETPPPATRLVASSVYSTNSTASAAVTGIYATMVRNSIGGGTTGLSALLGLSADEFKLFPTTNAVLGQTYTNELQSTTSVPFWTVFYTSLYQINLAIEGINNSSGVTPSMKHQLIGELLFLRAFCHFNLVNVFGDVPIITTSDYHVNSIVSRINTSSVYDQIINDLIESQSLLGGNYLNPDGTVASQRVRPNRGTAIALLSRVYLYEGKWDLAEAQSTNIINNNIYQLSSDLNKVFVATNNKEAIWQFESPNNGFNAPDGAFLLGYQSTSGPSSTNPISLSDTLINSFEPNDLRRINWVISKTISGVTYNFPYKYKLNLTNQPPLEYEVVFRLAEQYLIRAEARAQQNNLSGGISDLDSVRKRAGLPLISNINPGISKIALLDKIMHERQVELFTEYGHRWFDLKRTSKINALMGFITPLKGGIWQNTDQLYPIPLSEMQNNLNIVQNDGY